MKPRPSGDDATGSFRPTVAMCGRCKAGLARAARFCGFCGASVEGIAPDSAAAAAAGPVSARRLSSSVQGTGTFAALSGATTLIDARPPWQGDLRERPSEMLKPGTAVGEFRIECLLGMGAMGAVYGAVHPLIGRRVAVKVLRGDRMGNADATARFVQEAMAASRVHHPNVVDVFTFGELADGRAYFAMEWLEGQTLRARLGRSLSVVEVCHIGAQLVDALAALHAQGVVHRDLKPDNIILVEGTDGQGPLVKVLDLGLAKIVDGRRSREHLTLDGVVVGSAEYVSPEQAACHQVDARADVYSLGVVIFELLTRRRPFDAPTAADLIVEHIVQEPPAPSSFGARVPAELDALVLAMLAKEPGDRPLLPEVRQVLTPFSARLAVGTPVPGATSALPSVRSVVAAAAAADAGLKAATDLLPITLPAETTAQIPRRLAPTEPLFALPFARAVAPSSGAWRWILLGALSVAAGAAIAWWQYS